MSWGRSCLAFAVLWGLAGTAAGVSAQATEEVSAREPRARVMSIPSDSVSHMIGGRVVDLDTGRSIVGAQVFLRGTLMGMLTDHAGRFRLDLEEPGERELAVRLMGYDPACFNVEFGPDMMKSMIIAIGRTSSSAPPAEAECREPEVVDPT
jgi:hypothetical protein